MTLAVRKYSEARASYPTLLQYCPVYIGCGSAASLAFKDFLAIKNEQGFSIPP